MAKRIKVQGTAKKNPDVHLYVLALIELARQLQAEETANPGRTMAIHRLQGDDL